MSDLETSFDGLVARSLAAGGVALVAIIGALLIVAFRRQPTVPASFRIAIRFGFVTLFSSLVAGAVMIARGMRLVIAGAPQAAYTTGGTLKPTHAVTMHAILMLPLLAWLLSFNDWSEERRVGVVWLGIAGYSVLAGIVALENIAGVPLLRTRPAVAALLTAGLIALATAGLLALNALVHTSSVHGVERD